MENPDFRDLLFAFNAARVEYMIIGAHALAVHGHIRATKDIDVWVRPTAANAERVMAGLVAFGAPTKRVSAADFSRTGTVLQIGVDPVRIDVTTHVDGISFAAAWKGRVFARYGGLRIPVIGRGHLIKNKKASGRTQDLADVEALTLVKKGAVKSDRRAVTKRKQTKKP